MGAKAAMTLALQHPALIRNLIAVDNAPVDAALKTDFHAYAAGMLEVARRAPRNRADADAILRPWAEDTAVRQFLLTNLVPTKDPEGRIVMTWRVPLADLARQLDAMGDFPPFDPEKTRFEGPMLIVRGTKSPYVADETLPVLGRFFPRFELVDVEAGHWLISENPEGFRHGECHDRSSCLLTSASRGRVFGGQGLIHVTSE
jgi:pimeloyl-ACP methyl ester carboxylesterase